MILSQFALLESSSVDDDLANLKKELSGSSKVCLPIALYRIGHTLETMQPYF